MDSSKVQPFQCNDLTLAKLRIKLTDTIREENDINGYQDECVDVILDYAVIYIKTVIRSMARHKRRYRLICPIFTGKNDKIEDKTTNKESPELASQAKTNKKVAKEQNSKIPDVEERNNPEEASNLDHQTVALMELYKSNDSEDLDASQLKKQSTSTSKTSDEDSEKRTKSTTNKRSAEENSQKTVKKKTNECVISEAIYSSLKFSAKDFLELLRKESHLIPLRSVYELYYSSVMERLAARIGRY